MTNEPTIMGIADSTHYFVGATDNNGNLTPLSMLKEVAVCKSLCDAKQLLRDNHIESATLNFQSAYDEMCGLSTPTVMSEIIFL